MRVTCPECGSKFKVPDKALGAKGRKLKCGKCDHQWHQKPPTPEEIAAEKAADAKAKAAKGGGNEEAGASKAKGKPKPKSKAKPKSAAVEPEIEEVVADPIDDPDPAEDDLGSGGLRTGGLDTDDDPGFGRPPLGGVSRFGMRGAERPRKSRPVALYVLLACLVMIPSVLLLGRTSLVEAWPPMALLYDTIGMHVPVAGEGLELRNVYAQNRAEGSIDILVVAGEIRNPTEELRSLPALRGSVLNDQGQELQGWLFTAEKQILTPGETVGFTSEFAAPPEGAAQVNVAFTDQRPSTGLGY